MNEEARVAAKQEGYLWLQTQRQTSCGSCAAKNGCSQKVLIERADIDDKLIKLKDNSDFPVAVGDIVEIAVPGRALVTSALQMYGLPLVVMLMVSALANSLYGGDLAAIVGAIAGFVIGLYITARLINRAQNCQALQPTIVSCRRAPKDDTSVDFVEIN